MAETGNAAALREARLREALESTEELLEHFAKPGTMLGDAFFLHMRDNRAALAAPPRKGRWKNGRGYEYEYAYCSECGRMQWAGWDTHKQAEENIESFADDYRFCPGCGAEMEGGEYVK